MQKQEPDKIKSNKFDVSGSETIVEKIKGKTPWLFGKALRKPKVLFPKIKRFRMDMPIPGRSISVIVVYIALFLLQMGILYIIYRKPPALGSNPNTNDPIFLYPDIQDSFIIEGIVASIFLFLCSLGFVMLYQASKYVYNKNIAIRILVIGIILVLVTFTALQAMITIKLGEKLFNV